MNNVSTFIPKSGRPILMRNARTGAPWRVSYNYMTQMFEHEPVGNLRHIRRPYVSRKVEPYLVPAGTH